MEQIELAANVMMASPNEVTKSERQMAETTILEFRRTVNPYSMCRQILECSKNELVLFETANLIGYSIVKEWTELCDGRAIELKNYLLQYLVSNPFIFHSVREHIVMAIAFIIEKPETPLLEKNKYYEDLIQLLKSGDRQMCILGCSMIQATCQEKFNLNASQLHPFNCYDYHKPFEVGPLLEIFKTVLVLLSQIGENTDMDSNMMPVLLKVVLVAEEILSWPFSRYSLNYSQGFLYRSNVRNVFYLKTIFEPYLEWKPCVLAEETIALFFGLLAKYQSNSLTINIRHHILSCLVQLSTLSGSCVAAAEDHLTYVKMLCRYLHQYLANNSVKDYEALGIASIIMKISLSNFNLQKRGDLAIAMVEILPDMSKLAILFIIGSAEERYANPEDQLYTEALDKILTAIEAMESYKTLAQNRQIGTYNLLPCYYNIFQTFLQYHLSPPEGKRLKTEDDEEVREEAQPDYKFYSIQISLITQLGCKNMESCLNDLSEMLEKKGAQLRTILNGRMVNKPSCINVFEDIYWLLMIGGQILGTPSNLCELKNYNSTWATSNVHNLPKVREATTTILTNLDKTIDQFPDINASDVKPFVRFLAAVFRIWKLDIDSVAMGCPVLLSPEVSNTLVWFMKKFYGVSFPNCGRCDIFYRIFKVDVHQWMYNFALNAIGIMLQKRSSEPALVKNYCKLLFNFPKNYCYCDTKIVQLDSFPNLLKLSQSGELSHLSQAAHRGLLMGLVRCGTEFSSKKMTSHYWNLLLDCHIGNFKDIVKGAAFSQLYDDDLTRRKVIYHLDSLTAFSKGVAIGTGDAVFKRVLEGFELALICLEYYHNYKNVVEVIMEAFLAASEVSVRISEGLVMKFHCQVKKLLSIYDSYNVGKRSQKTAGDDEDKFTDLLMLLKMITNCMIADYYYTCNYRPFKSDSLVTDCVGIWAMRVIIPLMNSELLKDPEICLQFYLFLKECSSKNTCYLLHQLENEVFKDLLVWLEIGLSAYGSEICKLCFDYLGNVCSFVVTNVEHELYEIMRPFLKISLNLFFTHEINSDAVDCCCYPVCSLIALYKDDFDEFMIDAIEDQTSQGLQGKLQQHCQVLREKCQLRILNYEFGIITDVIEHFEKFISLIAMCRSRVQIQESAAADRFSMKNLSLALSTT